MLIDRNHSAVAALVSEWSTLNHPDAAAKSEASLAFQRALARQVIEPLMKYFPGELVLTYHEFLARVPSGSHSFIHGSEIISETVRWVIVARMPSNTSPIVVETVATKHVMEPSKMQMRIVAPPQFLLPVQWKKQLWSIYRGSSPQPCYVTENLDKKKVKDRFDIDWERAPLDLSTFGEHLFRAAERTSSDWATQFNIAIGNDSVAAWLQEHRSVEVYQELQERQA